MIKSETEYDKFDLAFAEFFKGVEHQEEIPEEVWDWLENEYQNSGSCAGEGNAESPGPRLEELQKCWRSV